MTTVDTTDTSSRGFVPAAGIVTVSGRHRRSFDVVDELMDVLADEPRVVECDLEGMTVEGSAQSAKGFARVGKYLTQWSGTVVMAYVPDPKVRAHLYASMAGVHMLIHTSWHTRSTEPHWLLPPLRRERLRLAPGPTAPNEARAFVDNTLLDWRVPQFIAAASEVGAEVAKGLSTDSTTGFDVILSHVDDRVRIVVRSHEPAAPAATLDGTPATPLSGQGLHVVQALARAWGAIPALSGGQSVWAVLDRADPG